MVTIGLIGTGRMGSAMWRRLQEQSVEAVVADASPAATAALAAEGAKVVADAAGVAAGAEIILLSLPTSADVEDAAFGPGGIVEGAARGALVVDLTSGVPSESRRIAERLATADIDYLDAGVSGGVGGARAGTLKAMVGGTEESLAMARPVLDLLTSRVWHCGPVGSGHLVKTLLNQSNQAKLMVELEALIVAARAGLDVELVGQVLDLAVWNHWLFGSAGREPVGFALALACKDFDIALRVATEEQVAVPVAAAAQQAARIALADAGPDADLIDTVAVWERLAGVRIAKRQDKEQDQP
jgi:3-hydroxyisobutyrate dehydrogenase